MVEHTRFLLQGHRLRVQWRRRIATYGLRHQILEAGGMGIEPFGVPPGALNAGQHHDVHATDTLLVLGE